MNELSGGRKRKEIFLKNSELKFFISLCELTLYIKFKH